MLLAPVATATIYQFEEQDLSIARQTTIGSIFAEYNTETSVMTWEVDNIDRLGEKADGFWLVTNNGPENPKGDDGLAIFYADFSSSSLWAFAYNGKNNPSSYNNSEYLGDFSDGTYSFGSTFGFSIDVSSIYDNLSTDAPFDEQIGIWFHPNFGLVSEVDQDGRLTDWKFDMQTWYDSSGRDTTTVEPDPDPVPTPATLPMLLLGLAALRRKQKLALQNR